MPGTAQLVDGQGAFFCHNENLYTFESFAKNVIRRRIERIKGVFSGTDGFGLTFVHTYEHCPTDGHNAVLVSPVLSTARARVESSAPGVIGHARTR